MGSLLRIGDCGLNWVRDMTECKLTKAEINHLRRLLGYVRCEIGQTPDELKATMQEIAPAITEISEGGKQRMVEAYQKSASVPKYVRAAVTALEKTIIKREGEIVDTHSREVKEIGKTS